ncbi:putative ATP-grasp-modified RiPP [Streptomyces hainanensis]|uniref:Putative ATP-grasp-modified RiPP n=1 Tax=Streptomyces hainanensis TaxID=402648 RepID=A0A4V2Y376_9ACTN|nr:putative ATP-grasp-modified RiPP [Streptomyces hainanensis]TDC75435.1 putative ATP-grasp-modified RiPP [Streptomyces hainanensis]
MSTLAPPVFPKHVPTDQSPSTGTVQPFGMSTALLSESTGDEASLTVGLSYCPERQVAVTENDIPFIHEPSMKSAFETVSQTREDMQLAVDKANDKD